jgi:acyl-CoA synthetase (NDP forming)
MSASGDLRAASDAARNIQKPIALLWTGGCTDNPLLAARDIAASGVPVFTETMACIRAMGNLVSYGKFLRERAGRPAAHRPTGVDFAAARVLLKATSGVLTERASRNVLEAYGLPRLPEALALSADEAVSYAASYNSPVALKIESPDIAHKTEAGGVRLGLLGADAVRSAFEEIVKSASAYRPGATLNGVLVQPMAPAGLDMIVGLSNDPTFGPVIVVGVGGIHVEVMRDLAYRVAPVDAEEARKMLRDLRAYALLEGVRGAKARDIDALVDAIVRLSWLGKDCESEIAELDINPVRIGAAGEGLWVLDALIATVPLCPEEPGQ